MSNLSRLFFSISNLRLTAPFLVLAFFVGTFVPASSAWACAQFFSKSGSAPESVSASASESGSSPESGSAPELVSPYRTVPLHPAFLEEAHGYSGKKKVRVFTPEERELLRVRFESGLLFDASGAPLHTDEDEFLIFVMDSQGEFFTTKMVLGEVFHSSLSAYEPMALTGRWQVHQGRLIHVNDMGSHYLFPDASYLQQARHSLTYKHGVDVSGVDFQHFRNPLQDLQIP